MKKIGVIGSTGRMGRLLQEKISDHKDFVNGIGFSNSLSGSSSLEKVFAENDYVIDFSQPELLKSILEVAIKIPKPLVICTTGWNKELYQEILVQVSQKMPLVIASNTSVGAYLQRYLVSEAARILGSEYDIDIFEKHHRHKVDLPSGTAHSLIQDVQEVKFLNQGVKYDASMLKEGLRPDNLIAINVQRSGNIPGEHDVTFTSDDEMISIRHVALNRAIFAKGALRIVEWLDKNLSKPGLYMMKDILGFSSK